MEEQKKKWMGQAVWIGRKLFDLGRVTGTTANLSFRLGDSVFITRSGGCFGTLTEEDFAEISLEGEPRNGKKPSKEWPLHLMLYNSHPSAGAVLHTHSFYATLFSCLEDKEERERLSDYTPYLNMKLGSVGFVPYGAPGSRELFERFRESLTDARGYLLANHGQIVAGKDPMDAFACEEELEESARTAWNLKGMPGIHRIS